MASSNIYYFWNCTPFSKLVFYGGITAGLGLSSTSMAEFMLLFDTQFLQGDSSLLRANSSSSLSFPINLFCLSIYSLALSNFSVNAEVSELTRDVYCIWLSLDRTLAERPICCYHYLTLEHSSAVIGTPTRGIAFDYGLKYFPWWIAWIKYWALFSWGCFLYFRLMTGAPLIPLLALMLYYALPYFIIRRPSPL